jgi:ubiquinone/menaquinone biosynthesis C-methylase UbiE
MNNCYTDLWREALMLPGETDLIESGVRELAEYFGISREEARAACDNALADSKREWESAERQSADQIVAFYRTTRSYLFEHVWWHATDVEANAGNAALLAYAQQRGAREYMDFGSGVGANAILFARHGFNVTLADVSQTMLEFARWRIERRGLRAGFIDLNRNSLPDGRFDFVTAVDVCEHLADPGAELGRISRAMRPGGALVFNYRAGFDEERPMHILESAAPVLRAIRANGFQDAGSEADALRALEFHVVERKDRNPIREAGCAIVDRIRYSPPFMPPELEEGAFGRHSVEHPQRIYFERVQSELDRARANREWLVIGCGSRLVPAWLKGSTELEATLRRVPLRIVGIDPDADALRENLTCDLRIRGDAAQLPFEDARFDLVTANMVFEYLPQPERAIAEIRRVLRPGGKLIAITTNGLDISAIGARSLPAALQSTLRRHAKSSGSVRHFRLNRPRKIERLLAEAGFRACRIDSLDQPKAYLEVPVLSRIEAVWSRIARQWPAMRGILLITAE